MVLRMRGCLRREAPVRADRRTTGFDRQCCGNVPDRIGPDPLVVAGILYLDTPMLALVLSLMVLVGAYEMGRLAHLRGMTAPLAFAVVAVLLWLAQRWLTPRCSSRHSGWYQAVWWTGMTVALVMRRRELPKTVVTRPIILLLRGLVLVTAWVSIVRLHGARRRSQPWCCSLFVLIWIADTGAYFAGVHSAAAKLSPFVSPGKTWAGVGGAIKAAGCSVGCSCRPAAWWVSCRCCPGRCCVSWWSPFRLVATCGKADSNARPV